MKLVLFDTLEQLCDGWEREFTSYNNVTVFNGPLEDIPSCDCLVSPGNSFGIMDGGFDSAVRAQFPDVQENIAETLTANYAGEIPVGQSVIVPTNDTTIPWLAYTPTMRFPRNIVAETVYDAMRAMFLAVNGHNMKMLEEQALADEEELDASSFEPIESIACPGLGTNTGGVGAFKAARMMRMAYETIFELEPAAFKDWDEAENWLKKLYQS